MTNFLAGLDFYKLTMSQLALVKGAVSLGSEEVVFELKNRGTNRLSDVVSVRELQAHLDEFIQPFKYETSYLKSVQFSKTDPVFSNLYLSALDKRTLPPVTVGKGDDRELTVTASGPWWLVTFWETIVMSTINELYYAKTHPSAISTGHKLLSDKIDVLRKHPEILFSDFGTRRRFSLKWHMTVLERLADELPGQLTGTSNPYFSRHLGLHPIGTFAHEMPMVYAAMADRSSDGNPLESQNEMFDDWYFLYGDNLSVALTDTFGSDYFFRTFGSERAHKWAGLRHDSGDPFKFGEKAIAFYKSYGIYPMDKKIVFSDGLDIGTILSLNEAFKGRINLNFGWGTNLMNDMGPEIRPNNIVMKATKVGATGTVKLSDSAGKHTGTEKNIKRYIDFADPAW